jgi:penicillin amidase
VKENKLDADAKKYLEIVKNWNLQAGPDSKGQTVFSIWWDSLSIEVWADELGRTNPGVRPNDQTLLEIMLRDSSFKYVDNINTPQIETWYDVVTTALQKATPEIKKEEEDGKLEWSKHKDPTIYHLLRTSLMPFARKGIPVGGNGNVINAVTKSFGPSWRMIVHLSMTTEAYAVYPGGQSGNPGSKFYDNFVDTWAKGEYYTLWMMNRSDAADKKIKWKISFSNK